MAELSTLARPYARAAFEYAVETDALASWSSMLETLCSVVEQQAVVELLNAPDRSTGEQAQALIGICGDSLDERGQNLVKLLAENRRLLLIPFIREQFESHRAQREKTVDVEVLAAREIDAEQQEKLRKALSKRLERNVNVTTAVDKTLIGGVLIRAGDTIIDGSLRGRLNKLAEALNS